MNVWRFSYLHCLGQEGWEGQTGALLALCVWEGPCHSGPRSSQGLSPSTLSLEEKDRESWGWIYSNELTHFPQGGSLSPSTSPEWLEGTSPIYASHFSIPSVLISKTMMANPTNPFFRHVIEWATLSPLTRQFTQKLEKKHCLLISFRTWNSKKINVKNNLKTN